MIGSVTTIGFFVGGTIGASVMASLGINLTSNILGEGSLKLKSKWINGKDGILNHDIQRALLRAFDKSIIELQKEYSELEYSKGLSKENKKTIKLFFKKLKDSTKNNFNSILTNILNKNEIQYYLSKNPEKAEELFWSKINLDDAFEYDNKHLKMFFKNNLHTKIRFWFGEELKTDTTENNKAWRAFQRLLLEGIKDDIKSVKANQNEIKSDLKKLENVESSLKKLENVIDKRLLNEPFINNIKQIQNELRNITVTTNNIDKTTKETETKVDYLINKLVKPETKIKSKIPDEIQKIFDEANEIWEYGNGKKTKELFTKALNLSIKAKNNLAIAKSNKGIASVLFDIERRPNEAKTLFNKSLITFKEENDISNIINVLTILGVIETETGDLDRANSYLFEALEISKKEDLKEKTSSVYHRLGWLEHHQGNTNKAIDYYEKSLNIYYSLYNETVSKKKQDDIIWGIASCYHHKGLTYRAIGDVHNTFINFEKAIQWYKKADIKFEVAKLFYVLSELSYVEGKYDEGAKYLSESKNTFAEIENHYWAIKCIELDAKINFTIGNKDKSLELLNKALSEANKIGDIELQVTYTNRLGYIYLENKENKKAKEFYNQAKEIAISNELTNEYKISLKKLAEIAHFEKNFEERDNYLNEGIKTLEKQLVSARSKPRQGYIYGDIGSFYDMLSKNNRALEYFEKSKKIFKEIGDITGIVNCLGSIARIKRRQDKKNEEFDIYREMKKILDGTPYYDLIAGTSINLGEIHFGLGNLSEAKVLFDEALFMCKKYNLSYTKHLEKTLERLSKKEKSLKPTELDFHELIDELFSLVNWFPEAKDSILRLWLWARQNDLHNNYKNNVGVKFMICQNNLEIFNNIVDDIQSFGDLFLQVVSDEYPGNGIDMIPYPMDKPIFFDIDMPTAIRL